MFGQRRSTQCNAARYTQYGLRIALLLFLLLPWAILSPGSLSAQTPSSQWSAPVNLSRSGAASQPMLFAGPEGALQAFWWDRFDGLTTAVRGEEGWSEPLVAQIFVPEDVAGKLINRPLDVMPTLVADAAGRVHAFWQDKANPDTGLCSLLHSRLSLGSVDWSAPDVAAPAVATTASIALQAAPLPDGGVVLAYTRQARTAGAAPGLYVKRLNSQGLWSAATMVSPSPYFRLLEPGRIHLRLTVVTDDVLHLAWTEPSDQQALVARSLDGGATWSAPQAIPAPQALGGVQQRAARPRVAPLPGGAALLMYEIAPSSDCTVYQQRSAASQAEDAPSWDPPQRIPLDAAACPGSDRFWLRGEQLIWVWGEGSEQLALLAWDAARAQWSQPLSLDLRLPRPDSPTWLAWDQLRLAPAGETWAVLGLDAAGGDVWFTQAQSGVVDLFYAPPSPWSPPQQVAGGAAVEGASVAVDQQGSAHMVWTVAPAGGVATLYYARRDGAAWSRAAVVAQGASPAELLRHPTLLADAQGLLHLAWSGGEAGAIYYSRSKVGEAASAGWSAPQDLRAPTLAGAWPQLGIDGSGALYILYVAPLNEGRGVYLAHSQDAGESWSLPELVFDAVAEDWAMVDHPALAVALDGALHAVWVRAAVPGVSAPQGIYYASAPPHDASTGQPRRWSDPQTLAEAGYDWPQLAWLRGDIHLLCAREGDGSVWHRWVDAQTPAPAAAREGQPTALAPWQPGARVPGWQGMAFPVGLGLAGDTLHLAGIDRSGLLHYAFWQRSPDSAPRWSEAETLWLGPDVAAGLGTAAGAPILGGRLAVALLARSAPPEQAAVPTAAAVAAGAAPEAPAEGAPSAPASAAPRLLAALRAIPTIDPAAQPTWQPTPRPTAAPLPTATPLPTPTPLPDLSGPPATTGSTANNLLLGGGLAGILVLAALGVWGLTARR